MRVASCAGAGVGPVSWRAGVAGAGAEWVPVQPARTAANRRADRTMVRIGQATFGGYLALVRFGAARGRRRTGPASGPPARRRRRGAGRQPAAAARAVR